MTLWTPPVRSALPLDAFWRTLRPHRISGDLVGGKQGWTMKLFLVVPRSDHVELRDIAVVHAPDDRSALIAILPHLPGIMPRLALLEALA